MLDYEVSESGRNLPSEKRKKIMLVRTLLAPSPVLALDEPLNHLDADSMQVAVGVFRSKVSKKVENTGIYNLTTEHRPPYRKACFSLHFG